MVQPNTRATSRLQITELEINRSFSGVTFIEGMRIYYIKELKIVFKISLLISAIFFLGRVVVILNHEKFGFIESHSGSIYQIFKMAIEKNWIPVRKRSNFKLTKINEREGVRASFSGVCKFRLGFNQVVVLEEEELEA